MSDVCTSVIVILQIVALLVGLIGRCHIKYWIVVWTVSILVSVVVSGVSVWEYMGEVAKTSISSPIEAYVIVNTWHIWLLTIIIAVIVVIKVYRIYKVRIRRVKSTKRK